MVLVDGQANNVVCLYPIINSNIWNRIKTQKEIIAAGNTPDYTEDYMAIDTFSGSAGDNSRVAGTTVIYDSGNKTYYATAGGKYLQTATLKSGTSNITGVFVTANKTTQGTSTLDVSVSIDNGSSWEAENQTFGTFIDTSGGSGTQLVLKFNFSGAPTSHTATLSDYGVMIWH